MLDGNAVAAAFLEETRVAVDQEHRRLMHNLAQLSEEDVWRRPGAGVNSIGTVVLHLCGNLRQWFLHGVGGAPDVRDRAAEFAEGERPDKAELLRRFGDVVGQIHGVLDAFPREKIMERRRIQNMEQSVLSVIYSTVTHLEGHSLQIAYVTHQFVGERYVPFWKP